MTVEPNGRTAHSAACRRWAPLWPEPGILTGGLADEQPCKTGSEESEAATMKRDDAAEVAENEEESGGGGRVRPPHLVTYIGQGVID